MKALKLFNIIVKEIENFDKGISSVQKSTLLNKHFKEGNASLRNENIRKQIKKIN